MDFKKDWFTEDNHFLFPQKDAYVFQKFSYYKTTSLKGHIFILTSGSTHQSYKIVALPKKAFLSSAKAVNKKLGCTSEDIWLNILPTYHVGGVSIMARAATSQCKVVDLFDDSNNATKWCAKDFVKKINQHQATLTSLVPTQVFDLVHHRLQAPESLKYVVVGGGALNSSLFQKIKALGWPVVCSYGMTEAASQIAVSTDSIYYEVLPHLEIKQSQRGTLLIKGEPLFNEILYFSPQKGVEKKVLRSGWYDTKDFVQIQKQNNFLTLKLNSRERSRVKIKGFLIDIEVSNEKWKQFIFEKSAYFFKNSLVFYHSHERDENNLVLITKAEVLSNLNRCCDLDCYIMEFNKQVQGHEKIKATYFLSDIPRTSLGKVKRHDLESLIGLDFI